MLRDVALFQGSEASGSNDDRSGICLAREKRKRQSVELARASAASQSIPHPLCKACTSRRPGSHSTQSINNHHHRHHNIHSPHSVFSLQIYAFFDTHFGHLNALASCCCSTLHRLPARPASLTCAREPACLPACQTQRGLLRLPLVGSSAPAFLT